MQQPDLYDRDRKTQAVGIITMDSEISEYRADFGKWLRRNWFIYLDFEKRALRLVNAGRENYSSKTICCVIRYDSALRANDDEYKINDKFTADLGRLFEDMNPAHKGFFRMRVRRIEGVANV